MDEKIKEIENGETYSKELKGLNLKLFGWNKKKLMELKYLYRKYI